MHLIILCHKFYAFICIPSFRLSELIYIRIYIIESAQKKLLSIDISFVKNTF